MSSHFAVATPLPAAPPAAYDMDTSCSDHRCHDAELGCRDTVCILAFDGETNILRMLPGEGWTPGAYHTGSDRKCHDAEHGCRDTECILAFEGAVNILRMLPREDGTNATSHTIERCTCTTHSATCDAHTTSICLSYEHGHACNLYTHIHMYVQILHLCVCVPIHTCIFT